MLPIGLPAQQVDRVIIFHGFNPFLWSSPTKNSSVFIFQVPILPLPSWGQSTRSISTPISVPARGDRVEDKSLMGLNMKTSALCCVQAKRGRYKHYFQLPMTWRVKTSNPTAPGLDNPSLILQFQARIRVVLGAMYCLIVGVSNNCS
jgi:hypothetical protein